MTLSILDTLDDEGLFAATFAAPSWQPWRAFLGVLFGLQLPEDLASLARACTGRQDVTTAGPFREAWLVVGRRGGKSLILALIAVYLAVFRTWRHRLAPGEVGVIMVLAADKSQAGVILGYVKGLLQSCPMLAVLVTAETAETVELGSLRVSIEVHTSSYRSVRGRTMIGCLADEAAFWRDERSANPAAEVLRAIKPGLSSLAPDSLLIVASSPYSRSGVLWEAYRRHHGCEGSSVLVWQAASRTMNSGLPAELVADALEADPEAAAAEYLAEFRRDVAAFVSREVLDGAVVPGRHELPRVEGARYRAFLDPSGGSADSFTLAIAHRDGERAVLDLVREVRPPFSPEKVAEDYAATLRSYGITRAVADRYAGVWVVEAFARHGIVVEQAAKPKSDLYGELLPGLNSGRVELLDHARLLGQLSALERRTSRAGKDTIDHGPGGHDDVANAAAGALAAFLGRRTVAVDFKTQAFINKATDFAEELHPSYNNSHLGFIQP